MVELHLCIFQFGAAAYAHFVRQRPQWTDTVMLLTLLLTLISSRGSDTTITFGAVTRELTGDTIPETLTLTGVGRTIDDLAVTFEIRSSGRTLYTKNWRLTRAHFDPRRRISDAELRARLHDYGRSFFADSKFMSPAGFVSWLESAARLRVPQIPSMISPSDSARGEVLWHQMQAAPITVFSFSSGGDLVTAIAWSATDQRFYPLMECC